MESRGRRRGSERKRKLDGGRGRRRREKKTSEPGRKWERAKWLPDWLHSRVELVNEGVWNVTVGSWNLDRGICSWDFFHPFVVCALQWITRIWSHSHIMMRESRRSVKMLCVNACFFALNLVFWKQVNERPQCVCVCREQSVLGLEFGVISLIGTPSPSLFSLSPWCYFQASPPSVPCYPSQSFLPFFTLPLLDSVTLLLSVPFHLTLVFCSRLSVISSKRTGE